MCIRCHSTVWLCMQIIRERFCLTLSRGREYLQTASFKRGFEGRCSRCPLCIGRRCTDFNSFFFFCLLECCVIQNWSRISTSGLTSFHHRGRNLAINRPPSFKNHHHGVNFFFHITAYTDFTLNSWFQIWIYLNVFKQTERQITSEACGELPGLNRSFDCLLHIPCLQKAIKSSGDSNNISLIQW